MRPRPFPIVLPLLLLSACEGASKSAPRPGSPPPAAQAESPADPEAAAADSKASDSAAAQAAREGSMPFKTSKTVSPEVQARYCNAPKGPAPTQTKVLRDSAGNIGGYVHQVLIRDSPIYYLDCDGKPLALFHIFGSDEEKKKNTPIIDALRQAFPVEEALPCPGAGKQPGP